MQGAAQRLLWGNMPPGKQALEDHQGAVNEWSIKQAQERKVVFTQYNSFEAKENSKKKSNWNIT